MTSKAYHCRMRILLAASLTLLLAACAAAPQRNPLAEWVPSPNFEARRPLIIVIHATEQASAQQSLDTLRSANGKGPVSAHYLIGDDGRLYQLVADADRAWHAGGGRWGTITDLNNASIGIEIDNEVGEPYTEVQIATLLHLLDDLTTRLGIPKTQVIGHADLAPTRKRDPGPQTESSSPPGHPANRYPSPRTVTTKRGAPIAQPSQSIDDAIAAGVPPRDLDALVKQWGQYNLQEAARKAKEATEAMASSVQARRRKIADELLKIADGYGISMSEARNIFEEARAAEKGGKLK